MLPDTDNAGVAGSVRRIGAVESSNRMGASAGGAGSKVGPGADRTCACNSPALMQNARIVARPVRLSADDPDRDERSANF